MGSHTIATALPGIHHLPKPVEIKDNTEIILFCYKMEGIKVAAQLESRRMKTKIWSGIYSDWQNHPNPVSQ